MNLPTTFGTNTVSSRSPGNFYLAYAGDYYRIQMEANEVNEAGNIIDNIDQALNKITFCILDVIVAEYESEIRDMTLDKFIK